MALHPEGLGSQPSAPAISNSCVGQGGTWGAARRILDACALGAAPAAVDLEALAAAVLERRDVRLALEVKAGGAWSLMRAVELAELMLSSARADRDETG